MRVFVFGCGFSAGRFLQTIAAGDAAVAGGDAAIAGGNAGVAGVTTRSAEKAEGFRRLGWTAFLFDGTDRNSAVEAGLAEATHLLVSVAPGASGDPVLAHYSDAILRRMPALEWIGYLSTVGVYGDHGGAWVDEDTPVKPVSARSLERVAAEAAWSALAAERGVPLAILRLSGIYGPGRNAFVALRDGKARRLVKANQVFNRIHVDDIAGALRLLGRTHQGGIVNVTDDEPAPPQDVVEHAARLAGVPAPPAVDFDTATLSPMARSFYGENKRVGNAKLKRLGYTFFYPHYRAGLASLLGDFSNFEGKEAREI